MIGLLACGFVVGVHAGAIQNWPQVGHDTGDTRFSPLTQINDSNVEKLGLAWYYDLDTHRGQEATPVVIDGVMYSSSAWSKVQAFAADSGKLLWQFDPQVPRQIGIHVCCDVVNRGIAVSHGRVYVGTLDGRLIALDARSGKSRWSVSTVDNAGPYSITGAPLVMRDLVVIGNAGAEYGVRGYVTAYDAITGKQRWRFYTVPGDPAKGFENEAMARAAKTWTGQWWHNGGGGTVWNSLSYDPELGLLYFGTGNAAPWGRNAPPSDDLYTASIVAVHAANGAYAWHYQTTPGDMWDYDADQSLTLATLKLDGQSYRVIMQANKNGFFYVLDRRSGELLSAKNFVPVNWASGVDMSTGKPTVNPQALYTQTGKAWLSMPAASGGHNWQPAAFSPMTGLMYIPAQEGPAPFKLDPQAEHIDFGMNVGQDVAGAGWPPDAKTRDRMRAALKGYLLAWDPVGQHEAWRAEHAGPSNGGTMATAGNLVFQGTAAGELIAYRASDGQQLWASAAQTGVIGAPMTFTVHGRQYVSIVAGWGGVFAMVAGEMSFKSGRQVNRSRVLTYALDATQHLPVPLQEAPRVLAPPLTPQDPTLTRQGGMDFQRFCAGCHGIAAVSGGLTPDLRYSVALADDAFWNSVVNEGALASQGMVSFKTALSEARQAAIRAYVIQRAQDDSRTGASGNGASGSP